MTRIPGRIVFDLVLLAAAAWGLWLATRLPPSFSPGQVSAGFFPSVVLGLGVLVMLVVLWQDIRALRAGTVVRVQRIDRGAAFGLVLVTVELVAYIALLEPLGFLISTGLFLFVAMLSCAWVMLPPEARARKGRIATSAAVVAVAATALTYIVFTEGFGLIFP